MNTNQYFPFKIGKSWTGSTKVSLEHGSLRPLLTNPSDSNQTKTQKQTSNEPKTNQKPDNSWNL